MSSAIAVTRAQVEELAHKLKQMVGSDRHVGGSIHTPNSVIDDVVTEWFETAAIGLGTFRVADGRSSSGRAFDRLHALAETSPDPHVQIAACEAIIRLEAGIARS